MKILISAGESSGDLHGASFLRAIQSQTSVEAFGIGGAELEKAGLDLVVDSRSLAVMGFIEVLARLPELLGCLKKIVLAAQQRRPDLAVLIDYPDFHFLLAKRLRRLGIPVIYYIPPKVWVWRKYRVQYLKKYFEKILCIFPFEEKFYQKHQVNAIYVGNPLMHELPLGLTRAAARLTLQEKLLFNENDRLLVLMPGSRRAEVAQHLEVMLQATLEAVPTLRTCGFLQEHQVLQLLIPMPAGATSKQWEQFETHLKAWIQLQNAEDLRQQLNIQLIQGKSDLCLAAADAALVKSGTSTLEAALLDCLHVLVYKPEKVNGWIFRNLIRYRGPVGLVNLILGGELQIPEILYDQVSVVNLKDAILRLCTDQDFQTAMRKTFQDLHAELLKGQSGQSPSERVAQEVLQVYQAKVRGGA